MKLIYKLLILVTVLSACETDDVIERKSGSVPRMDCIDIEEERGIIAEYKNENSFILAPDENCPIYRIDDFLWACNLPKEFQKDSLKVSFSGYLYESLENADVCAETFELTEIEIRQ
ncbi:hypothetical protein SAMN05660903_03107 [Salegentibacter salinarum]|nr:hypothetical protein [Salegentibacter salinarum]SKB89101.1 hypothetical protein SAMN05660903_03107 [Salegentibacter salinarum]